MKKNRQLREIKHLFVILLLFSSLLIFTTADTHTPEDPASKIYIETSDSPTLMAASQILEDDSNDDGLPDVYTTITFVNDTLIEIHANDTREHGSYKWASAICGSGITIEKEEYNPATQVWTNTGPLNYGTLFGLPSEWCAENSNIGYSLFGAGSGDKTYRLILSEPADLKIYAGAASEESIIVYQNTSTVQFVAFENSENDITISAQLFKEVAGNYSLYPNDIFVSYNNNSGVYKFGANDSSVAENETNTYKYVFESRADLKRLENRWYYMQGDEGYYINVNDICFGVDCKFSTSSGIEELYAQPTLFGQPWGDPVNYANETTDILIVEFENTGGWIDPSYSVFTLGNQDYISTDITEQKGGNITHLDINDTAERHAVFDGTGDYITTTSTGIFKPGYDGAASYSIWFKTTDSGTTMMFGQQDGASPFHGAGLQFVSGKPRMFYFVSGGDGDIVDTSSTYNDGNWYHLAATTSGTNADFMKIYIDGVEVATTQVQNNSGSSWSDNLAISFAGRDTGEIPFNGSLDEGMIFNRELTAAEVLTLNNSGREGGSSLESDSDLVLHYTFDDYPENYNDNWEGGYDGTANGDTYTEIDTNYPYNDPYSSLVGYWSFDADDGTTAYDLSDLDNDGTYTNDAFVNTTGLYNDALGLDGNGDYISVPHNDLFNLNATFAISAWIYVADDATNNMILGHAQDGSPFTGWAIDVRNTDRHFRFYPQGGSPGVQRSNVAIPLNEWTHVGVIRNGGGTEYDLYINGAETTYTSTTSVDPNPITTTLQIGEEYGDEFNGSIDEVMIFNTNITAQQMLDIYNNQSSRFKTPGDLTFKQQTLGNIGTDNRVNLTLDAAEANLGSNLSGRVGTWELSDGYNTTMDGLVAYYHADIPDETEAYFTGTSTDHIDSNYHFNDGVDFGASSYSFSAWIWSDDTPAALEYPIWQGDTASGTRGDFGLRYETSGAIAARMNVNGISTEQRVYYPGTLATGQWVHLAAVWNTTTRVIYMNGVEVNSSAVGGTLTPEAVPDDRVFQVGRRLYNPPTADGYFDGLVDEVMIWNRSLSASEVSDIYNLNRTDYGGDANLELYYSFDDRNATDLSGNGRHGTFADQAAITAGDSANDFYGLLNGDTNVSESGVFNNSFGFDGAGDYIEIADSSSYELDITGWAFSSWIKTNQTSTGRIVSKRDSDHTTPIWNININGINPNTVEFRVNDGSSGTMDAYGISIINDDEWHHIVGVVDSSSIYIYVDGVLEDTDTNDIISFDTTGPLYLGQLSNGLTYFNGSIDEVMIFNRSLTAAEAKELYIKGRANWQYTDYIDFDTTVTPWTSSGHNITNATNLLGEVRMNAGNQTNPFYTPYITDTGANLTTWFLSGNVAPTISIVHPTATTYTTATLDLNYTATDADANLDVCWYSLDLGVTNSSPISCNSANFTSLSASQGSNTWTVWANDTSNELATDTVTFTVDSLAPQIQDFEFWALNSSKDILGNESWFNTGNLSDIEYMNISFLLTDASGFTGDIGFYYTAEGANACALGNNQSITCYEFDSFIEYRNGTSTSTFKDEGTSGDFITIDYVTINSTARNYTIQIDEHYNPNVFKWYSADYNFSDVFWQTDANQRITSNKYLKVEVNNTLIPTDADQYKLDFRANYTTGTFLPTQPLEAWACNSTYSTGDPELVSTCALVAQKSPSEFQDDGTKFRGIFTNTLITSLGDVKYIILKTDESNGNKYYSLKTIAAKTPAWTTKWEYSTTSGGSWDNKGDGYESELNLNWFSASPVTELIVKIEATDSNGLVANSTEQNMTWSIDATQNYAPLVNIITPNAEANISGSININWSATDPNSDTLRINISTELGQIVGDEFNDGNYNWDTTTIADGLHNLTVLAWENATVDGFTGSETRVITVDNTPPQYSSITQVPANGTAYVSAATYEFNITWTDATTSVSDVLIEFNGVNYTPSNTGSLYNFTITDLGAGVYSYYWRANDTLNNVNISTTQFYTIVAATGSVNLTINGTQGNQTIEAGATIDINGTLIGGSNPLNLYRDGVLINQGNSPIGNTTTFNSIGTFEYKLNSTANANSTAGTDSWNLTVQDTTNPTAAYETPTETSGATITEQQIDINVSGSDLLLDTIRIRVYNSTQDLIQTNDSSTSPLFVQYMNSDGLFFFNATVNDTSGNKVDLATRNVTIDSTPPEINITNPTNTSTVTSSTITLQATNTTEAVVAASWIYSLNGAANTSFTPGSTNIVLADGSGQNITMCVNDTIGNIGCETMWNFRVSSGGGGRTAFPTPNSGFVYHREETLVIGVSVDDSTGTADTGQSVTVDIVYPNGSLWKDDLSVPHDTGGFYRNTLFIPSDLPFGTYEIRFVGTDFLTETNFKLESGNAQTSSSITFVSPTPNNGALLVQTFIEANVTATDNDGIDTITLSLFNTTGLVQTNTSSTSPLYINFSNLTEQEYKINATVNDTSGGITYSETRTITLTTASETSQSTGGGTVLTRPNPLDIFLCEETYDYIQEFGTSTSGINNELTTLNSQGITYTWSNYNNYVQNWQFFCSDGINRTLEESLVCDEVYFFLIENDGVYSQEQLTQLRNEISFEVIEVSEELTEYYVENYNLLCPDANNRFLPLFTGVDIFNFTFADVESCNPDLNGLYNWYIPSPISFQEAELTCEEVDSKRVWFKLEENGNDLFLIKGFKIWWIVFIIIGLSIIYVFRNIRKIRKKVDKFNFNSE